MTETILLCRDLVASADKPVSWTVALVLAGGQPESVQTGLMFSVAYNEAVHRIFGGPIKHRYDATFTNRPFDVALSRIGGAEPNAQVYCPEGGADHARSYWTVVDMASSKAGERFHGSNLKDLFVTEKPGMMENRPFTAEIAIRHDWRAIDFCENVQRWQAFEANTGPTLAEVLAVASEKDASVRQFGIHSPYFRELYGNLTPKQWDTLWQGWQLAQIEAQADLGRAA